MRIKYLPTVNLFDLMREIDKTYGTSYSKDPLAMFAPECQANDSYFSFYLTDDFDFKYWARNGCSKDLAAREKCARLIHEYLLDVQKLPDTEILVWVSW